MSLWLKCSLLISSLSLTICSGADLSILLDGSGSMKGFYKSGQLTEYVQKVDDAVERSGLSCTTQTFIHEKIVHTTHGIYPMSKIKNQSGNFTDLALAFDDIVATKCKSVLLITDNLAATPTELGNTQEFYRRLQSKGVVSVHIIPKFFPFSGSATSKGVLIYLIQFDSTFSGELNKIKRLFNQEELLLIKPITHNEILTASKNSNSQKVNSTLRSGGVLLPTRRIPFQFNEKNRIKFDFTIQSNLPHMKILTKGANNSHTNLVVSDLLLSTKYDFIKVEPVGKVTPELLQDNLDFKSKSSSVYECRIDFVPKMNYSFRNLKQISQFNFSQMSMPDVRLNTQFNITINVPPTCFALSDDFKERYFSTKQGTPGKIFSPVDMLQMINTDTTRIDLFISNQQKGK